MESFLMERLKSAATATVTPVGETPKLVPKIV